MVVKQDGRDLINAFRRLAPQRRPIAIQRWSVRRVVLAVGLLTWLLLAAGFTYGILTPLRGVATWDPPACTPQSSTVLVVQASRRSARRQLAAGRHRSQPGRAEDPAGAHHVPTSRDDRVSRGCARSGEADGQDEVPEPQIEYSAAGPMHDVRQQEDGQDHDEHPEEEQDEAGDGIPGHRSRSSHGHQLTHCRPTYAAASAGDDDTRQVEVGVRIRTVPGSSSDKVPTNSRRRRPG